MTLIFEYNVCIPDQFGGECGIFRDLCGLNVIFVMRQNTSKDLAIWILVWL